MIQPFALWPGLLPDASHRLSLVALCSLMGVTTMTRTGWHRGLPWSWMLACLALAVGLGLHAAQALADGQAFRLFHEAALFADGGLVLLALPLGAWALLNVPLAWMRRLPILGAALLVGNLLYATAQAHGLTWRAWSWHPYLGVSGLMGMDRCLGAWAAIWAPVLWVSQPWLGVGCAALVMLSGKMSAVLGLSVAAASLMPPRRRWIGGAVAVVGALGLWTSGSSLAVWQRLQTYWHTIEASLRHPWIGWGFHPMRYAEASAFGYTLPSAHSDWLSLAFHGGWVLVAALAWVAWRLVSVPARSSKAKALRAGLLACLAMSAVQTVVGHARIGSLVLLFIVWYFRETHKETVCAR